MAPVVLTCVILTKFVTFERSLCPSFFADLGKIRHESRPAVSAYMPRGLVYSVALGSKRKKQYKERQLSQIDCVERIVQKAVRFSLPTWSSRRWRLIAIDRYLPRLSLSRSVSHRVHSVLEKSLKMLEFGIKKLQGP